MSVSYTWVGWNAHKRRYDAVLAASVVLYLVVFFAVGKLLFPPPNHFTDEALLIRGLGTCSLVMLHVVLWIGPLARLDPRLLPLLYNRRHLGVSTFAVAFAHGVLSTVYYHGFGNENPIRSLLTANTNVTSLSKFPFELLGVAALAILFVMAATSHDFFNKNLSARWWKWVHMAVYPAYGLVVGHVALGVLQSERHAGWGWAWWAALGVGAAMTVGLHVASSFARAALRGRAVTAGDPFVPVCGVDEIPAGRARVFAPPGGERIAVFKHDGKVSAVTNVCEHQGGPLGEGKIIGGCITCPWHGWQYRPEDGCSPPPFTEKIATYRVTIRGRTVCVDPTPLPRGTRVEPAIVPEGS